MTAAVRVEFNHLDDVVVDAPAGLLSAADLAALADVVDALRPTIARAIAPPLPPRAAWPTAWREAHAERWAVAAEGGALDAEAVAGADLRVMVARGELDPLGAEGGGR